MPRPFLLTLFLLYGILVAMSNMDFSKAAGLKPAELIISDLKWKYLVRGVMRAKNIMIIGPSGCAKTMAARCVATALKRPFAKFNIGQQFCQLLRRHLPDDVQQAVISDFDCVFHAAKLGHFLFFGPLAQGLPNYDSHQKNAIRS